MGCTLFKKSRREESDSTLVAQGVIAGTLPDGTIRVRTPPVSLILSIESSTARASLALLRDSEVVFEGSFESDRNHNSMLFEPLRWSIAEMGGEPLDLVVVGTGPGSYSGTRVGIAAGQGVAMIHACPAVGLSSLKALGVSEGVVVGDARRGSAWLADLDAGLPQPELVPAKSLKRRLKATESVFALEEVKQLGLPNKIAVRHRVPTAVRLAKAWIALPESLKEELFNTPPQPAYLRPPHITEAKKGHPLLRRG